MLDVKNVEAEAIRRFFSRAIKLGNGNAAGGVHQAFAEYFGEFNAARNQRPVATNPATPVKRNINEVYGLGRHV